MIKSPDKVKENTGIFEITDETHPAFIGRKSSRQPAYGAFALRRMPKLTVLGVYGGHIKVGSAFEGHDADPADGSDERAHCQFFLQLETETEEIYVDADKFCNHLAFCNDYRTDLKHWDDPSKQDGYHRGYNKRHNADVVMVWKEGELFPRLFFITMRAVAANEELLIDYGIAFWQRELEQDPEHEHEQACSQSSQESSVGACSQSSQPSKSVGLRRRNSLGSPGLTTTRASSPLVERERMQLELDRLKEEISAHERLFEEKIRQQRRVFEQEQCQRMEKVKEREKELRLVGRQVLENFPGHGAFRGRVIEQVDAENSRGYPVYTVCYTDGQILRRSEDKIIRSLVDRDAEDQQAMQQIAELPPASSDEEDEEEVVVEGKEHEESTQPFADDERIEHKESTKPGIDDESADCTVAVGHVERVWSAEICSRETAGPQAHNSAFLGNASVSPPAETVCGPAIMEQPATQQH